MFDKFHWMFSDKHLERIADATDNIRRYQLMNKRQISNLTKMDEKAYKAGLLGSDSKGLFKP
jgi:hypothetical protein